MPLVCLMPLRKDGSIYRLVGSGLGFFSSCGCKSPLSCYPQPCSGQGTFLCILPNLLLILLFLHQRLPRFVTPVYGAVGWLGIGRWDTPLLDRIDIWCYFGSCIWEGDIDTFAHERHGHLNMGLVCPRAQAPFLSSNTLVVIWVVSKLAL